jgi:pimeloyl-ACP methyl ester carboxylesterase
MILLCPSGMGDEEQLPVMEGVRAQDAQAMVNSVFHKPKRVDREVLLYYKSKFNDRTWKKGLLRTIKGTQDHTVREQLKKVTAPTLLITASGDKVCDPKTAEEAARGLPHGHFRKIERCGHAPQIEKHWLINRLVVDFLSSPQPTAHPSLTKLILAKPPRANK